MRRAGICLWMVIKRMGRHPAYWILLLLFPIAFFAVPKFNRAAEEEGILAGYVVEETERGETAYCRQILSGIKYKLSEDKEQTGLFQYIEYTEINELKKDILTGKLSGGVVFGEDFTEKLTRQDYWHCITLYLPEGMNAGGMMQEDVFARVYQAYSAVWYTELLEQQGHHIESEEVLQKFSEYQKEGKVFTVNYEVLGKDSEALQNTADDKNDISSVLSLRGIFAFMTLMSSCLGALDGNRDRKRNIGKGMPGQRGLEAVTVGAPVLISTLLLAAGMLFANANMTQMSFPGADKLSATAWILLEVGSALLYGCILWLLAILCSRSLPEKLLEGMIPCFLLVVLICCPIFLDLGGNIPLVDRLSKLFPITWYLEFWG